MINNTEVAGTPSDGPSPPPALPAASTVPTGRGRDPMVVASPGWLARFSPPTASGDGGGGHPPSHPDDGTFLVAELPRATPASDIPVHRVTHIALRLRALDVVEALTAMTDGAAIAALTHTPEVPVASVFEDAGSPSAVARLAEAIGVAPTLWPTHPDERLRVLLHVLEAAGSHPDAPARRPRINAFHLALRHRDAPQPLYVFDRQMEIFGRVAGFGPGPDVDDLLGQRGLPQGLTAEEAIELMAGSEATRLLFREAAHTLARMRRAASDREAAAAPG